MIAGINQSQNSHIMNTSKLLDKSNDTALAEPAESPDDMNQSNHSLMNVPPEEDAREQIEVEPVLHEVLKPDCQQCLTAIQETNQNIPPEMRIEKQINMDMLRRCNQALDNSQDLINFYHKLVKKVEK